MDKSYLLPLKKCNPHAADDVLTDALLESLLTVDPNDVDAFSQKIQSFPFSAWSDLFSSCVDRSSMKNAIDRLTMFVKPLHALGASQKQVYYHTLVWTSVTFNHVFKAMHTLSDSVSCHFFDLLICDPQHQDLLVLLYDRKTQVCLDILTDHDPSHDLLIAFFQEPRFQSFWAQDFTKNGRIWDDTLRFLLINHPSNDHEMLLLLRAFPLPKDEQKLEFFLMIILEHDASFRESRLEMILQRLGNGVTFSQVSKEWATDRYWAIYPYLLPEEQEAMIRDILPTAATSLSSLPHDTLLRSHVEKALITHGLTTSSTPDRPHKKM